MDSEAKQELPKFPFSDFPQFKEGANEYHSLVAHHGSVNSRTGEEFTKGLSVCSGQKHIWVLAKEPEEYSTNVRKLLEIVEPILNQGKVIRADFNLPIILAHSELINDLIQSSPGINTLNLTDLTSIRIQMMGFGKAALDAGDLRTAILAFDTAKALKNPQIRSAVHILGLKQNIDVFRLFKELGTNEIDLSKSSTPLKERPKRITRPTPVVVVEDNYYSQNRIPLTEIKHTGTGTVYFVGGPNGKSVVKYASDYFNPHSQERLRLLKEAEYLKAAKGAGGLPVLELILQNRGDTFPRGIQIERILGKSLYDIPSSTLTPEKFGLENRLWLIYDLVEAYKATGIVHGDLLKVEKRPNGDLILTGNKDNLILEDNTNRIRVIDYGLHPDYLVSKIYYPKKELEAVIEFLFMGKAVTRGSVEPLATSPQLQKIGQQMLDKLQQVDNVNSILDIVPPEFRLSGKNTTPQQ